MKMKKRIAFRRSKIGQLYLNKCVLLLWAIARTKHPRKTDMEIRNESNNVTLIMNEEVNSSSYEQTRAANIAKKDEF
jgi:hypothetical protein